MRDNLRHGTRVALAGLVMGVVFCLAIGLMGWTFGWRTAIEFSNGFFMSGSAVIIFGMLALWGGFTSRGDFAQTAPALDEDVPLNQRLKWIAIEVLREYNVLATTAIIGLVMIGMSIIAYQFFG